MISLTDVNEAGSSRRALSSIRLRLLGSEICTSALFVHAEKQARDGVRQRAKTIALT